jgi:hypothetical protein
VQKPSLDDRIEQLSAIEAFPPPPGFAEHAQARDPADSARAAADGPAWWAAQARERLSQGSASGLALEAELREHVAGRIGRLARPKQIIWAEDLPKTRSGKIMRRVIASVSNFADVGDVTTLANPEVVEGIRHHVQRAKVDKGEQPRELTETELAEIQSFGNE